LRIDELGGDDVDKDGNINDAENEIGYAKAFTDPQYARASFVGVAMAMF